MHSTLLKLSAAILVGCAAFELYLVFTAAAPAETRQAPVNARLSFVLSIILPLGILVGAALIYQHKLVEGIGVALWSLASHHIIIGADGRAMVAFAIGLVGILVGIAVLTQRDRVEQDEIARRDLASKSRS